MADSEKNTQKDLPFEKALEKLEILVGKMEEGNLPLDQMIAHFEQGCALSKMCRQKLEKLEKKIEVLLKEDSEGGKWVDFDDSSARKDASLAAPQNPSRHSAVSDEDEDSGKSDLLF